MGTIGPPLFYILTNARLGDAIHVYMKAHQSRRLCVSGVGIIGVLGESVRRVVRHLSARHVGGMYLNHG